MKSTAKAILFGSFILATQAAMAADVSGFPGVADEAGATLAPRATQAVQPASARTANVALFPGAADEAGVSLPVRATYADTHPIDWNRTRQGTDAGSN